MPRGRRRIRQKNSLVGLWIGLGVGGGCLFLLLVVLLVTTSSQSSPQQNPGGDGSTASNPLFGGNAGVDDGSPAFISHPQFFKDRHGQSLLRVNYELKRPQEIPAGDVLIFQFKAGTPGQDQAHLTAPRDFLRSELKDRGTLDLPLYNFLKMTGQYRVRFPDAEVYWEVGGRRLSNKLIVPLPTNPNGLPTAPEIVEVARQASRFQVNLTGAQYDGGFIPKLYVEIHPSRGEPEPQFEYVLVCKQVVMGGGFSRDQTLNQTLLRQGGRVKVESPAGFHSNSSYELHVEAYLPNQRQAAAVISNILNIAGPNRP